MLFFSTMKWAQVEVSRRTTESRSKETSVEKIGIFIGLGFERFSLSVQLGWDNEGFTLRGRGRLNKIGRMRRETSV